VKSCPIEEYSAAPQDPNVLVIEPVGREERLRSCIPSRCSGFRSVNGTGLSIELKVSPILYAFGHVGFGKGVDKVDI
jgi:hypothetical protein